MSGKPSDKPAEEGRGDDKVVPLRKAGPLSPKRKGRVSLSIGEEDGDLVVRKPDGGIDRRKV